MMDQHPSWPQYAEIVKNHCFDCIDHSSRVLEIGAGLGQFTKIILEKSPSYVEVVEPDPESCDTLKSKFQDKIKIKQQDIFSLFDNYEVNSFDTVVAFGVLYHWSSPFYFLEQIVNKIQPRYIFLDNPYNNILLAKPEELNITGNCWTSKKAVGISLHLTPELVLLAMNNLGYTQLLKRDMKYWQVSTKEQSLIWKFERQNIER
jgi:SAM-dependent methyltransferase